MNRSDISAMTHRNVSWHEYTNEGELLSCGTLSQFDPVLVVTKRGRSREYWIRCAGSGGLRRASDWPSSRLCLSCPDRTTPVCLTAATGTRSYDATVNLAFGSETDRFRISSVAVPVGCPHATNSKVGVGGIGGRTARTLAVLEKTRTIYPISWKLTKNKGKIDLCIQYRRLFVEPPIEGATKHKEHSDTLYCHITCDTGKGTTYISDLHANDTHYARKDAVSRQPLETLTYTSESKLFSELPKTNDLHAPIRALYDAVSDELNRKVGAVEPIHPTANAKQKAAYIAFAPTAPAELLRATATCNRFPRLGFLPLTLRKLVPLHLKRRFDKLPREISRRDLADALGLPRSEALDMLYESEDRAFEVVALLCEYGITDVSLLDKLVDVEEHLVVDLVDVPPQEKFVERTNLEHAYRMLDMYIPFHSLNNPVSNAFALEDMVGLAVPISCAMSLAGEQVSTENDEMRTYHESFIKTMISSACPNPEERILAAARKNALASFTKFKHEWITLFGDASFNLEGSLPSNVQVALAIDADHFIMIDLAAKLYLDRRSWTKKKAREFFLAVAKWLREKKTGKISVATQEKYEESCAALSKAVRFSFSVISCTFHLGDISLSKQEQATVLYNWADRSGFDIALSLEQSQIMQDGNVMIGEKARRNIQKRKRRTSNKKSALIEEQGRISHAPQKKQ